VNGYQKSLCLRVKNKVFPFVIINVQKSTPQDEIFLSDLKTLLSGPEIFLSGLETFLSGPEIFLSGLEMFLSGLELLLSDLEIFLSDPEIITTRLGNIFIRPRNYYYPTWKYFFWRRNASVRPENVSVRT